MTSNSKRSLLNLRNGFCLILVATLAVVGMASGERVAAETLAVSTPVVNTRDCLVLDAAVFGSSSGQASMKSAPTTWSSRSQVRWNARWASAGRYVV